MEMWVAASIAMESRRQILGISDAEVASLPRSGPELPPDVGVLPPMFRELISAPC
jgi:hypothetical protein